MKKILYAGVLLLFTPSFVAAQNMPDTTDVATSEAQITDTIPGTDSLRPGFFTRFIDYFAKANEDKTMTKKIDFSVIGGPHYSSSVKFGLGVVAAGLYRVDKKNLDISPSNISFFGDVTTKGFYLLGVSGNTYFNGAKYRLDYNAYFFSFPSSFWGIGYDNATNAPAESYKRLQNQVKADFMYRLARHFYIGTNASFNYIEGKDFSNIDYLQGEDPKSISVGVGVFLSYDSRDFIPSPHKGMYIMLDQRFFPKGIGNDRGFTRTEFTADFYKQVWNGGILAYDLHAQFNYGDPPWTMLALMGGQKRMRGYYEGRYRDRNLIETQLELRQKVYRRNGIAVWVGAGNIFPKFSQFDFSHTLPNYGVGYRWEFKKRVNVRLDYGFGKKGQSSFMFGINEAF